MKNRVTKKQMRNYIGLLGTIKRIEEQILRIDEVAAQCTANINCVSITKKTETSKKLENCVVNKTVLQQELEECQKEVNAVDAFLRELRLVDSVTALAMELYFFSPIPVSYDTLSHQLSNYVPNGRAPTGSALQKRFERLLEYDDYSALS